MGQFELKKNAGGEGGYFFIDMNTSFDIYELNNACLNFKTDGRLGIRLEVQHFKTSVPYHIRKMGYDSFNYITPRIFNVLPIEVRNFQSTDQTKDIVYSFKNHLDKFLATIPDQPTTYREVRAASSNSLIDQIHYQGTQT